MEKVFKVISKTLSTVLVSIVVLLAVFLAGVRLIGFTPYTVLSGSMEPTYHVGSIIYVVKVDPADLKLGDPVTFRLSGDVIATHRIVEVIDEGTPQLSFRTKGDANETVDGAIPASAVIGKPVFTIPYLGFVSSFIQTPKGLFCVLGSGATAMVVSFVIDAFFPKKKESESEPESEETIV